MGRTGRLWEGSWVCPYWALVFWGVFSGLHAAGYPPGEVQRTCSKHWHAFSWTLVQITASREKWQPWVFLPQMVYFLFQKWFPLYGGTPEETVEQGDFLPVFPLKERKFGGICGRRKARKENPGQGMWPNHIEMHPSPGREITRIPAKIL